MMSGPDREVLPGIEDRQVVMRGRCEERAFAMRIRHTGVWAHSGEDWFRVAFHDTYEHLDP
jgi:hypothetical protein